VNKILALAGGAIVGIGCFLPLLSLSLSIAGVTTKGNVSATDMTAGKVALVFAFAALLLAALDLRDGDGSLRRWAAGCALVGASIIVYKSWTLSAKANAALSATTFGHVSVGIGMWVALVGGGVALASDFVGRE
jgi:hypothetical protein